MITKKDIKENMEKREKLAREYKLGKIEGEEYQRKLNELLVEIIKQSKERPKSY